MQHVILGLLMISGPLTLYTVQRAFTQGVSLFYSASFGSIQRALRQLVDRELVTLDEADGARGSRPYRITDAGRSAWRAWMSEPLTGGDFEQTALAKTFFLGLLDSPADRREVVDGIRDRIAADLAELEQVAERIDTTEVPSELADVFSFQRATLDYGLLSHAAARAWFDDLAGRLADPPHAPGGATAVRG